ncbi:MAG: PAS domain-containing protein [Rhodospirillales bacterium]|nr:PAS domain-containing protein [Rhodospirillales bacterium]
MLDQLLSHVGEESSRYFLRYWFQIRGDRLMPERRDIDPTALAPLLPKMWLWDVVPERRDFRCRLAGEEITALFGRNPRGTLLGEWVPMSIVDVARPRYQRVIDEPAICVASGMSYVADDKQAWCERVITPMTEGSGPSPAIVFGITSWRAPDFVPTKIEREETTARFFPLRLTK